MECFYAQGDAAVLELDRRVCVQSSSSIVNVSAAGNTTTLATQLDVQTLLEIVNMTSVLICSFLIFFMQLGFAILEAGIVRPKNLTNILFKNLADIILGIFAFWLIGSTFALSSGSLIGTQGWYGIGDGKEGGFLSFFFQWTFAGTAATIVSGALAGRCKLEAYFILSFVMSAVIYPVVAHMIWGDGGLLSIGSDKSMSLFHDSYVLDFAGSGVVHMTGGIVGLIGAAVLGVRKDYTSGKFNRIEKQRKDIFVFLGTGILWFGWYGFNCGTAFYTMQKRENAINVAALVAINTTISAASSAIVCTTFSRIRTGMYNLTKTLNAVLAGLVSVTAGCAYMEPWGALLTGSMGSVAYLLGSNGIHALKIDDPLEVFSVHGVAGIWGLLAAGIFATSGNVKQVHGEDVTTSAVSSGAQVGYQVIGILLISAWTSFAAISSFLLLKMLNMLRVTEDEEKRGLDFAVHGKAYVPSLAIRRSQRSQSKASMSKPDRKHVSFLDCPRDSRHPHDRLEKPGACRYGPGLEGKRSRSDSNDSNQGHGVSGAVETPAIVDLNNRIHQTDTAISTIIRNKKPLGGYYVPKNISRLHRIDTI